MQLFNAGAARAYASNFRPWTANGGYESVKSDTAKQLFTKIPFVNFQAEVEMAKRGLMEEGSTLRQKMVNDTSLELLDKRQEFAKEQNKKGALIRMLSGGSGAARRGGSSNVASVQSLLGGDPLSDTIAAGRQFQAIEGMVNADLAGVKAAAATGLKAPIPQGGSQVQLLQPGQSGTAPAPKAPELSSLRLDEDALNEVITETMKGLQGGAQQ